MTSAPCKFQGSNFLFGIGGLTSTLCPFAEGPGHPHDALGNLFFGSMREAVDVNFSISLLVISYFTWNKLFQCPGLFHSFAGLRSWFLKLGSPLIRTRLKGGRQTIIQRLSLRSRVLHMLLPCYHDCIEKHLSAFLQAVRYFPSPLCGIKLPGYLEATTLLYYLKGV